MPKGERAREIPFLSDVLRLAERKDEPNMTVMHCRCAGLDVHQKTIAVCVLRGEAGQVAEREKATFATVTADLLRLAEWLREREVTHVAMESSGVYWRPVWAVLEGEFELLL